MPNTPAKKLLSFAEACEQMRSLSLSPCDISTMKLNLAQGRILAHPVPLPRSQPPFDRATMDGYAVAPFAKPATDDRYLIKGEIAAGDNTNFDLLPGEAVRIMTGARAPQGTAVIPIERCEEHFDQPDTKTVAVPTDLARIGINVALCGEDAAAGDNIGHTGASLSSGLLAALGMAGAHHVSVYSSPRVTVLTTGNEVGGDTATNDTAITNSNAPFLSGLLASIGIDAALKHNTDDLQLLTASMHEAALNDQLIITTGGVSAGDYDHLPAASQAAGFQKILHGIAMQPGKPVYLGRHPDGCLHLGLPGNPVSVVATAHLFLPILLGQFWPGFTVPQYRLPLVAPARAKRRDLFLPARLANDGITPMQWHGSGDLFAAAAADGLLAITAGEDRQTGDSVIFHPFLGQNLGTGLRMPRFGDT